jgi:hypothetical protein
VSEINVISRTQAIIIDPASTTVQVINGPPKGAAPSGGLPVISGLSHRGTAAQTITQGGNGVNIFLNSTAGQIIKVGTDVEIVDAGASTYQMRVKQTGLYHISGYIRLSGVAPAGETVMGLRVNGSAAVRGTFVLQPYASVNVTTNQYLNRDDLVSVFMYTNAPSVSIDAVPQSNIDPYSPRLDVWRVSTVQLV